MREQSFNVKVEFESKIVSDDEIKEIMKKMMSALIHEVDCGDGLAPDNSDTFTVAISIKSDVTKEEITHNFLKS